MSTPRLQGANDFALSHKDSTCWHLDSNRGLSGLRSTLVCLFPAGPRLRDHVVCAAGIEAGAAGWVAPEVLLNSRAHTDDGPGV